MLSYKINEIYMTNISYQVNDLGTYCSIYLFCNIGLSFQTGYLRTKNSICSFYYTL